ncbi:hypothetical protein Tco_1168890, partial [Tanacetum coccineum]
SLQGLSTLGTSLKRLLSKGIVHHPRLLNSLKTSTTSSKKAMNHYTKLGNRTNSWDDTNSSSDSSSNTEGLAAIVRPHLDKEYPLNEEVKLVDEVKYGEFRRPAPFNGSGGAKFRVGLPGYYTRTDNQTPSGEKRPKLVKTINKYMEGAVERQAEQDEWLKTFCQNTKKSQIDHDKIIQKLDSRVKTLAAEVETKVEKLKECKTIFANDGTSLYTPFYYSPEELEYFYANSGFSDDEKSGSTKLKTSNVISELKSNLPEQMINHYAEPYVPPIPFPNRLKQHAEEALVHKSLESLKKISINRPLLKEIRQTDNYPKYMKDLVANKQLTKEDDEVSMNPRCSTLLQNQLPPKENDPGSFILPCCIERMPVILGRPFLAIAHAKVDVFRKAISPEVGNEKKEGVQEIWASCSPFEEKCNGGSLGHNEIKCYWESKHDGKRIEVNLSLNDWNEYDDNEEFKDPNGCEESKENKILGTVLNNLHDEWFKGTDEDDDDLEGIINYLKPTLYDGFIDSDDEEYKERKYSIGPGEVYTKIKVSRVEELSKTRGNIATIRAGIMDEIFRNDDNKESYDET